MKKILFVIFISLFPIFSFSQQISFKISPVTGTWVESVHKTDTLIFNARYEGDTPGFLLQRAQRMMPNGHSVPGWNAGYYHYVLDKNLIKINWLLSSDSRFKPVFFMWDPGKTTLKIGDFFSGSQASADTLTFIRIK